MNDIHASDKEVLHIREAQQGTGNSISVNLSFILERLEVFRHANFQIYAIEKTAADGFFGKRVYFSEFEGNHGYTDKQIFALPKNWESRVQSLKPSDLFKTKLDGFLGMSPEKRTNSVGEIKSRLAELKSSDMEPMQKAREILDAVENAFVLNKASLKLKKEEVTANEKNLAQATIGVVNQALALVEDSEITSKLFEAFSQLSNGQTLNHINRVFTSLSAFMYYSNSLFDKRLISSVRQIFPDFYRDWYGKKFKGLQDQYLVADNMVHLIRIDPTKLTEWALGAFLHDMGKIANFDYFESEQGFNFQEIKQHVFISSGLILMNYGLDHEEARLMAGDHHNVLFHQDGYGVTRFERERGMRKLSDATQSVSSTADDYIAGRALSFLPTEMLAACDVYDAMIDDSRAYKKPLSSVETLSFMKEKLVDQEKLDPLIFDLFVDFLQSRGLKVPQGFGVLHKIREWKKINRS